ncbi:MAG: flagellar basal body-associated FliL family protein [Candidatus Cloacimonetes bacterium]|nr:flagellar basal body-associated FliL family protein [Candidatus Cloacimonadota bacterium]
MANRDKPDLKIIIIILVANILFSLVLWLIVPRMLKPKKPVAKKDIQQEKIDKEKDEAAKPKDYFTEYAVIPWEDIVVNPQDASDRYLLIKLGFEYKLADKKLPDEIKNKTVLLTDRINSYLSEKKLEELARNDFREVMRQDINFIVNELLKEGKITKVLFSQYVIQ